MVSDTIDVGKTNLGNLSGITNLAKSIDPINFQDWEAKYEKSLVKIFSTSRINSCKFDENTCIYENKDYGNIYLYDKKAYIALMFYLRNIRNQKTIPKGKGERRFII